MEKATNLTPQDSKYFLCHFFSFIFNARSGLSDPFVVISFTRAGKEHDKKEKSKIIKKTLNPEWNETFSWPVLGEAPLSDNDFFFIQVWDDEYGFSSEPGYMPF